MAHSHRRLLGKSILTQNATKKSIRDYARNRTHPNVDNEVISQQLEDLVKPCVYNQLAYYKTRYPVQTWFNERPYAHESNFISQLLELITPKTLLLLDRGFLKQS